MFSARLSINMLALATTSSTMPRVERKVKPRRCTQPTLSSSTSPYLCVWRTISPPFHLTQVKIRFGDNLASQPRAMAWWPAASTAFVCLQASSVGGSTDRWRHVSLAKRSLPHLQAYHHQAFQDLKVRPTQVRHGDTREIINIPESNPIDIMIVE